LFLCRKIINHKGHKGEFLGERRKGGQAGFCKKQPIPFLLWTKSMIYWYRKLGIRQAIGQGEALVALT